MLPQRFHLHRPSSLGDVLDLLQRYGEESSVYAGGTELLVALKARVLHYAHLIDLKGVRGLAAIRAEGDELVIGALATHHGISTDPLVGQMAPAYARLSGEIANIRVRCAGTIGGNLCFAEPHADPPALLAALGARVRLEGPAGSRECGLDGFFHGAFETDRRPDEVMTAIMIPHRRSPAGAAYRSVGHLARPSAGAAALVLAEGGRCSGASLWLGAIGAAPIRLTATEAALVGLPLDTLVDGLSRHAAGEIGAAQVADDIHGGADYKRHLALVMLRRAVTAAHADIAVRENPA